MDVNPEKSEVMSEVNTEIIEVGDNHDDKIVIEKPRKRKTMTVEAKIQLKEARQNKVNLSKMRDKEISVLNKKIDDLSKALGENAVIKVKNDDKIVVEKVIPVKEDIRKQVVDDSKPINPDDERQAMLRKMVLGK